MSSPEQKLLLGRIAVHHKLISMDQLVEATLQQGKEGPERRLGDIFVERGWTTQDQIQKLLQIQKNLLAKHRLAQAADGNGRCAVNEILLKVPALANVIREGNTPMPYSIIQTGKTAGMQTMDDALAELVARGRVSAEDACARAVDKARFEKLVPAGV